MKPKITAVAACLAVISMVALTACGDDSSPGSSTGQNYGPAESSTGTTGATGPASAGDERPAAPDDSISDRPGGPNDKGENGKPDKSKPGNGSVSGGISTDGAPVSPEAP